MKIQINKSRGLVYCIKEKGDKTYRDSGWSSAESKFLYDVLQILKARGMDCIKKRMWKDGHMKDDTQQYIRDRKGEWCMYNPSYDVFDIGLLFNDSDIVKLVYVPLSKKQKAHDESETEFEAEARMEAEVN